MKTSFYCNTFWHHVTWRSDGKVGIDQHGYTWYNMQHPISETGLTPDGF
jgi:hypothetical protein